MNIAYTPTALHDVLANNPLCAKLFFAAAEIAVLTLVVWLLLRVARIKSARLASMLWLVVLAKPIVSLVLGSPVTVFQLQTPEKNPTESFAASDRSLDVAKRAEDLVANRQDGHMDATPVIADYAKVTNPASAPAATVVSARLSERWTWSRTLVGCWMVGASFFLLLSIRSRLQLRRLVRSADGPSRGLWARYDSIAQDIGIRRKPALCVSGELESPAIVGIVRPVVFVPSWLRDDSAARKLEWSLRHELTHYRHCDPLANAVRECAQILFFFHPVVWWVGRCWEEAAELACDRAIVGSESDAKDYAKQLFGMLEEIHNRNRLRVAGGLFATRTQIGRRIAALLHHSLATPVRMGRLSVVGILLVAAVAMAVGAGFEGETITEKGISPAGDVTNDDAITVTGRVLDPEGNPVAGARLFFLAPSQPFGAETKPPSPVAFSDQNGRFSAKTTTQEVIGLMDLSLPSTWRRVRIVAAAEGYGPAWYTIVNYPIDEKILRSQTVDLRLLRDDVEIVGRVLDLEGRPVANATAEVMDIVVQPKEGLASWVQKYRDKTDPELSRSLADRLGLGVPGVPLKTATNQDGRFTLQGIGRDRLAFVQVQGPGIASDWILVATALDLGAGPQPIKMTTDSPLRLFEARFDYTAEPDKPITGVVRDHTTGKPLAGVRVQATSQMAAVDTRTDASGRYRLSGASKLPEYEIAVSPDPDQPYLPAIRKVDDTVGVEPIHVDFALHRGVWIGGRISDKSSGDPIAAKIFYYVLRDNPHVADAPDYAAFHQNPLWYADNVVTGIDGSYRILGFPGRGVIGVRAIEPERYRMAVPLSLAEAANVVSPATSRFRLIMHNFHALAKVDVPIGDAPFVRDLVLDASGPRTVTIVEPNGRPFHGGHVYGVTGGWKKQKSAELSFTLPNPIHPQTVVILNGDRTFGGFAVVRSNDPDPLEIKLRPTGSIQGRLVDQEGVPRGEVDLVTLFREKTHTGTRWGSHLQRRIETGVDGRFRVDGLVAGLTYEICVARKGTFTTTGFVHSKRWTIEPGENKVWGDVTETPIGNQ